MLECLCWFQNVPFKFNPRRYAAAKLSQPQTLPAAVGGNAVGLCTLNQVDPWPITYSLSNL
jgi:hypothetical protein